MNLENRNVFTFFIPGKDNPHSHSLPGLDKIPKIHLIWTHVPKMRPRAHLIFLYRTGSPHLTFLNRPLMPCYHFWDLNAMFSPHIFAFRLQSSIKDIIFSRFPTSGSEMVLLRQVFSTRGSDTFVSMMSLMAFMYECYHHITLI